MDFTTPARDQNWGPKFQIYPNPVVDHLTLEMKEPARRIQIVNSTGGQILKREIKSKTSLDIGVSDFPNGFYHLIIEYINGTYATDKFVKVE